MQNTDDLSWLLVATKPRSELVARKHLESQGFQVCLPQITLSKRKQGVWQEVTEPMFPGYIFIGIVLGVHDLAPIRSTVGCLQVVRFGGVLVPLPSVVAQQLLAFEPLPRRHSPRFSEGQTVRIEVGVFAGLEAVIEQRKGADRVQVLLKMLGRLRQVVVMSDSVSAC